MTNKVKVSILFFSLLLLTLALGLAEEESRTTINIENARTSRYEKDKETGNDIIILNGDVRLSVTKGSNVNIITADVIRFDRKSEMLYADGNVSLDQTTASSGGQTVTANALMFNTSTLEGIFDDGRVVQKQSDAINLPSGATLIVASDIFGRSESNTIAFKNGDLTFCDDPDPHWKIKASRIWLLPGGEFAFLNALLFVGPIPVIYLPAFYYPKDELIFNPVFGTSKRRGYFINTTGYILGRKPLDTSTDTSENDSEGAQKLKALFNFIKPSVLKEQKIEGLMFHNLDDDYKGNTTNTLKVMADYYSNLGAMVGVEGTIKPPKYVTSIDFNTRLAFSDTVFKTDSDNYSPYSAAGNKYTDSSSLLGLSLPFRYTANLQMTLSQPFSLTLSIPLYSDPFFQNDFLDKRQEYMDWISYLISSAGDDEEEKETINETSSFNWTLSGSYSVPLPQVVKPYLSTISINLNSSIAFSTLSTTDYKDNGVKDVDLEAWKEYSPERKFYYPSQITPATISLNISGTIVDVSLLTKKTNKGTTPKFTVSPTPPDELLTISQKEATDKKRAEAKRKKEEEEAKKEGKTLPPLEEENKEEDKEDKIKEEGVKFLNPDAFPKLATATDSVTTIPGFNYVASYSIRPQLTTQLAYSSTPLKKSSDFDWNVMRSSMYTLRVPVTIDNVLSYAGSFLSLNSSFSYEPVFQEHPYINTDVEEGGYTESGKFSLQKTDYSAQKHDLTNNNTASIKPFYYIPLLKDTGITWKTTIKIIRTEFLSDKYKTKDDTPEWEYHSAYWEDEEAITTNDLSFILALQEMDSLFTQNITFTTTLKPQAEAYYWKGNFTFPYTTFSLGTGLKLSSTKDDAKWIKQPLTQDFSLRLFDGKLNFTQSYSYNLDDDYHDSLRFSLSGFGCTVSYSMSYTDSYDFDKDKGWVLKNDSKEFQPYNFSISYSAPGWTLYTWKNRISFGIGLSTSISADLVRPTNTSFTFSPSITFKIHEMLSLTFTATSKNDVIYRYFASDDKLAGEKNLFIDLFNSFRFDDDELRESTGFKLQSLAFDLTHEMHDWDLKFTVSVAPRLKDKKYEMNPYISLSIVWRPMAAMKAEIVHDNDDNEWKLK